MARSAPDLTGRPTEVVQRLRLQYTKRGRLRFTSHRDVARAFERALRRAGAPMAYSSGFTAHPKVSWVGAAPTGVASEAEYLEIALAELRDPEQLRLALDAALPPGLDVVACVASEGASLPDRIDAATWTIRLPGVASTTAQAALTTLLAAESAPVDKMTKGGRRTVDVRAALVAGWLADPVEPRREAAAAEGSDDCAILGLVVRQQTPAVRPDDVMAAFRTVAGLEPPVPPEVTRLDQGQLNEDGSIVDPLNVQDGARPVG